MVSVFFVHRMDLLTIVPFWSAYRNSQRGSILSTHPITNPTTFSTFWDPDKESNLLNKGAFFHT